MAPAPGGPLRPAWPSGADLGRRLPRLLLGLTLCGLGIAVMLAAGLGLGPWDVLHEGLSRRSGLPIGQVSIMVGAAVLLLWIPLRERPGVGTVLNVLVIGVVIDVVLPVLGNPASLGLRVAMMLSGPVLFAIGSGFYLGVDLGSGPRDGIMTGLARRGAPVAVARTGIELAVLGTGWLLGGTVGVGTLVFVASIGPLVHLCLPRLVLPERRTGDDPRPPGVRSAR